MPFKSKSTIFVLGSLCAKGLAGFAQLYIIYILTKMQSKDEAAFVLLLLGYAIWFQLFELGLSQTLQVKFNARKIRSQYASKIIILHFTFLCAVAFFIVTTPYIADALLPLDKRTVGERGVLVFSVGAALMVLASSNALIQRFLLIYNKGSLANLILICQSTLTILGLTFYWLWCKPNLMLVVIIYLSPQIFIVVPLLVILFLKTKKPNHDKAGIKVIGVFYTSLSFFGISILSAGFLGSDYYFVAHFLKDSEVISYYLTTRIFFISYVLYYAFILHKVKHFSNSSLKSDARLLHSVVRDSILLGVLCVLLTYFSAIALEYVGVFQWMTNGQDFNQTLLFGGLLYFLVRVFRDIALVMLGSLNAKKLLYKIYIIEIFVALSLMYLTVGTYGGMAVFLSMTLGCTFGILYLAYYLKAHSLTLEAI